MNVNNGAWSCPWDSVNFGLYNFLYRDKYIFDSNIWDSITYFQYNN